MFQSKFDEIRFNISGVHFKFSVGEFALITGLKCVDDFERNKIGKSINNLVAKFFNGSSKVRRSDIKECFVTTNFDCDEDALKMTVLYFISNFLFSAPKDKFVNEYFLDVVDADLYNQYPWGKDVFSFALDCVRRRFMGAEKKEESCILFYF